MSLGVGQVLDKYELLEEVGQGGMAVVYRGLDRSLKREVAVKVLHKHLAEDRESRARFAREAQAVAKLRHENILEIFDFSGTDSPENYIITEFIEGQTLKDFIDHYDIRFPEIGAMIVVEVCKALRHAHGEGILHRDIKPENIMVRKDGVVKLTDFGIAQMVDLQRMTLTGQLLGSPAYMSPEHVSGGTLDFRTDVFSVGILLYQLVTGDLPFTGRNPHETLKRIAECNFTPPEVANPAIGDRLARIIAKAMAREQDQRYENVPAMLHALESFLEESGVEDSRSELGRFFDSPATYEMAFEARLVDALTRTGKKLLHTNQIAALSIFNRILTINPNNETVLSAIDQLSRRRRGVHLLILFGAVFVLVGAAAAAKSVWPSSTHATRVAPVIDAATLAADIDAAPIEVAAVIDAGGVARDAANGNKVDIKSVGPRPRKKPDAGVAVASGPSREFTLKVFPKNSDYRIGGGPWQALPGAAAVIAIGPGDVEIEVRNENCCEGKSRTIAAGETGGPLSFSLPYLPGTIIAKCDKPGVRAQIDGRPARIDRPHPVTFGSSLTGSKMVSVEFFLDQGEHDAQQVQIAFTETKEVTCKL